MLELISTLLLAIGVLILQWVKRQKLSKIQDEIVEAALEYLETSGKIKELETKLSLDAKRELRKKTSVIQKKKEQ